MFTLIFDAHKGLLSVDVIVPGGTEKVTLGKIMVHYSYRPWRPDSASDHIFEAMHLKSKVSVVSRKRIIKDGKLTLLTSESWMEINKYMVKPRGQKSFLSKGRLLHTPNGLNSAGNADVH